MLLRYAKVLPDIAMFAQPRRRAGARQPKPRHAAERSIARGVVLLRYASSWQLWILSAMQNAHYLKLIQLAPVEHDMALYHKTLHFMTELRP